MLQGGGSLRSRFVFLLECTASSGEGTREGPTLRNPKSFPGPASQPLSSMYSAFEFHTYQVMDIKELN